MRLDIRQVTVRRELDAAGLVAINDEAKVVGHIVGTVEPYDDRMVTELFFRLCAGLKADGLGPDISYCEDVEIPADDELVVYPATDRLLARLDAPVRLLKTGSGKILDVDAAALLHQQASAYRAPKGTTCVIIHRGSTVYGEGPTLAAALTDATQTLGPDAIERLVYLEKDRPTPDENLFYFTAL